MKNKLSIFLTLIVISFLSVGCIQSSVKSDSQLQEEIDRLETELAEREARRNYIIENPSLGELNSAEIRERNAIHNEIQESHRQINELKKAQKDKEEKKKEEIKPKPSILKEVIEDTIPSLRRTPEQEEDVENELETTDDLIRVNTNSGDLTLRSNNTTNSEAIDYLPKNTTIKYTKSEPDEEGYVWYKVEYEGQEGWIRGDYIEKVSD